MSLTTFIEEKKKQFDEAFLATMYKDDGYSEERETLKAFLESSLKELAYRMKEELPEKTHRTQLELGTVHTFDGVTAWNVGFRFYRQEAIRKFKEFIGE